MWNIWDLNGRADAREAIPRKLKMRHRHSDMIVSPIRYPYFVGANDRSTHAWAATTFCEVTTAGRRAAANE
jgi:hypothetical protein